MFNFDIYIIFEKTKHLKTFYIPILVSRIKLWVWLFLHFFYFNRRLYFLCSVGWLLAYDLKLGHSKILNNCYQVDYFHTKNKFWKRFELKLLLLFQLHFAKNHYNVYYSYISLLFLKVKTWKKKNKKKTKSVTFLMDYLDLDGILYFYFLKCKLNHKLFFLSFFTFKFKILKHFHLFYRELKSGMACITDLKLKCPQDKAIIEAELVQIPLAINELGMLCSDDSLYDGMLINSSLLSH